MLFFNRIYDLFYRPSVKLGQPFDAVKSDVPRERQPFDDLGETVKACMEAAKDKNLTSLDDTSFTSVRDLGNLLQKADDNEKLALGHSLNHSKNWAENAIKRNDARWALLFLFGLTAYALDKCNASSNDSGPPVQHGKAADAASPPQSNAATYSGPR